MPTYEIRGQPYGLEDLILDLRLLRSPRRSPIISEAIDRGLYKTGTFYATVDKLEFFKEILGYDRLNGSSTLEECTPAQIGIAFTNTLNNILESAKNRVDIYRRLANEDYEREKEAAAKALEDFKKNNPEKHRENYLAAIRA